jgi:outer membrane protein
MAEAIQLALAHNRSIQVAAVDVKRADEEIKAVSTQRLPSFAVFAEAGESLLQPYLYIPAGALGLANGTPIPAQNAKLSSAQAPSAFVYVQALEPLTQQYRLSLQEQELKVGREISSQHLRLSEQEVVQQVRQLYCQIVDVAADQLVLIAIALNHGLVMHHLMDPRHYPDQLVTASSELVFDKLMGFTGK